jgi:hypothetical protein
MKFLQFFLVVGCLFLFGGILIFVNTLQTDPFNHAGIIISGMMMAASLPFIMVTSVALLNEREEKKL